MATLQDPPQQTLYDRIGGESAVTRMIHEFYVRVLDDEQLEPFFRGVAMSKLRRMQEEFFAAALDGPSKYTGRPLCHVHHGLGIKPHHLQRFVEHLNGTLEGCGLTEHDHAEIIGRINTCADEIVGGGGLDG